MLVQCVHPTQSLRPALTISQAIREELSAERRALSTLPWNSFVNGVVDTFSDSQNLYMVLELMPYGNFGHFLRDSGPFEPLTACFYYSNVLCGLEFVHSHDLVLRDLKPVSRRRTRIPELYSLINSDRTIFFWDMMGICV